LLRCLYETENRKVGDSFADYDWPSTWGSKFLLRATYGQVNRGTKWQVVECLAASVLRFRAKKTKQKEETHADLTEELKAEVKAIQETERESVNGDSLFGQVWGGKDELILSSILCRCKN
jgi:hypothetical protein